MVSDYALGQVVKEFRERLGLSPRDLGLAAQIDEHWLVALEAGQLPSPSSTIIELLASHLQTTTAEIYRPADLIDRLIGGGITDAEREFIRVFRSLSPSDQRRVQKIPGYKPVDQPLDQEILWTYSRLPRPFQVLCLNVGAFDR